MLGHILEQLAVIAEIMRRLLSRFDLALLAAAAPVQRGRPGPADLQMVLKTKSACIYERTDELVEDLPGFIGEARAGFAAVDDAVGQGRLSVSLSGLFGGAFRGPLLLAGFLVDRLDAARSPSRCWPETAGPADSGGILCLRYAFASL